MKKLALLTLGIILLFAAPACSQDKGEAQNATAPAASEEAAPPAATTATSTGQTGHEGMDMGAADNMAPGMHEQYSDKIFLSMMIPHHSGAVAMCNDVLKDGKDPQVKAWAEEMNKARRMAALQARLLAENGYAVLQIDLHGCGDSSGDLLVRMV